MEVTVWIFVHAGLAALDVGLMTASLKTIWSPWRTPVELLRNDWQNFNTDFTITKTCDAPVSLFADKEKLIQVITNYLTNAAKYSNGNYKIDVFTRVEGDHVIIAVQDYGKGIPTRDLPYIFNRFFRAQKTKNLEGLGLGLFLSRQIVTAHGGRTWVESEEGKGSTFYLSLLLPKPDPTSEN